MQVILQKKIGFCSGVERAVRLAREAQNRYGKVFTLGKLIHNERTVSALEKEGIIPVEGPECLKNGSTVVIRSHGVAEDVYEALKKKNINIIDATCPSVRAIRNKIVEKAAQGYFIIIVGRAGHPEVEGLKGWAAASQIVSEGGKIILPEGHDKIFVVSQTTGDPEAYARIASRIEEEAAKGEKTVEIFNSICYTTIVNRAEAESVSAAADAVLAIGDRDSSNTLELFATASSINKNTYLISNVSDLKAVQNIKRIAKLGIIAGASAPKELIMEVINIMDQENKVDAILDGVAPEEAKASEAPSAPAKEEAPAKAPEVKKPPVNPMEAALRHFTGGKIREGRKVTATIISVDDAGINVSVENTGKNDAGFISKEEAEISGEFIKENYPVGSKIEAVVIPGDGKIKGLNLSKKQCDEIKIEDEAVKKILEGEEFSLTIKEAIKGGLLGRLGSYTIFVPASQIRMGYVKNLEDYVGKKLRLRMLPPREEDYAPAPKAPAVEPEVPESPAAAEQEVPVAESGSENPAPVEEQAVLAAPAEAPRPPRKPNPKRIVASQRVILEEEKSAREEAFWEVMQVNNIIKGKVKRFTPFGAFVSIMNFDCLAHISDLSWTKINDPSEVLELGKSYDFVVIKVDRENGKVSLGYKQLQKKPYEIAAEKYHVGDVIKGKVERIKDFGAFVEIEPGIDGLVHVSEISYKWVASAAEALKVGDEIEAKIIGFENNKITLSIKALLTPPDPAELAAEEEKNKPRPSRFAKKFTDIPLRDKAGDKKDKKPRRDKPEEGGEPREYVSAQKTGATFADLFKDIDINKFEENEEAEKSDTEEKE
jgi:(E)-4-hydroxy-3-methyl-but-2-enyl pyrophosphate reductase (IPP and DMAPP forming)